MASPQTCQAPADTPLQTLCCYQRAQAFLQSSESKLFAKKTHSRCPHRSALHPHIHFRPSFVSITLRIASPVNPFDSHPYKLLRGWHPVLHPNRQDKAYRSMPCPRRRRAGILVRTVHSMPPTPSSPDISVRKRSPSLLRRFGSCSIALCVAAASASAQQTAEARQAAPVVRLLQRRRRLRKIAAAALEPDEPLRGAQDCSHPCAANLFRRRVRIFLRELI